MTAIAATPFISIVVPAFNAASVLADALRSIEQQQYSSFEALVVDDGSTDDTAAIARSFAARDRRFLVLCQPHAGVSAARNTALASARGEWIAFLDADDVWMAEKLARQVRCAGESPDATFIFSNYYLWDGTHDLRLRDGEHRPFSLHDFHRRLSRFNLLGMSTVMVKRTLMARVGAFDSAMDPAEDWDLWLRLAEAGAQPHGIPEPLARYRVWPGNVSHQTLRMAEATVRVLRKHLAGSPRAEWRDDYRRSLARATANLELAAARVDLDAHPESLAPAVLRAWRTYPRRLTWLGWYIALTCPTALGGAFLSARVHRQVKATW